MAVNQPQGDPTTCRNTPRPQKQEAELDDLFTHHKPFGDQNERYVSIREAAKTLARTILENTPTSADQNAALRHVREAVFTANAAIAVNEKEAETAAA